MPAQQRERGLSDAQCNVPDGLKAAIADLRSDTSATDWCLGGYEGDSATLALLGSGSGGVTALRELLKPDGFYYGLVRTTEVIDKSTTVKFVFITFIGEKLGVMRRAKLSTLKGTISEAFSPFHAEMLNATDINEVTDAAISALLQEMWGNAVASTPSAGGDTMRMPGGKTVKITQKNDSKKANAFSDRQQLTVPEDILASIRDVRSDASATNWTLSAYANGGLTLVGSGDGGADELATQLSADKVFYGMVRTTEQIDKSTTVKFIFLSFIGEAVGVMQKAKMSTLKGTVTEYFTPFHTELINASSPAEVSNAAMSELVTSMFGKATASKGDGGATMRVGQATVKITEKNAVKQANAFSGAQQLDVPAPLIAAIKDVRNDGTPTNWCLGGMEGTASQVALIGSGSGGSAEMAKLLKPDGMYYALLRTTERIDASVTVKFVFVSYLGESLSGMRKAKLSTLKGTVSEWFTPFHAEVMGATSTEEFDEAAIASLLNAKSGKTGEASAADPSRMLGKRDDKIRMQKYGGVVTAEEPKQVVPEAVVAAVRAVRSDGDPSSWCLLGYGEGAAPTLTVVATGTGPAEEMHPHFDATQMMYALVRLTQQVDRSTTIKFAFVSWVGDHVPPLRKAKLSTLRGEATQLLAPVHTELLNVTSAAEVSSSKLMAQLEGAVSID